MVVLTVLLLFSNSNEKREFKKTNNSQSINYTKLKQDISTFPNAIYYQGPLVLGTPKSSGHPNSAVSFSTNLPFSLI